MSAMGINDAAPSPGWREERRRDRQAAAQIERDNEAARAQARIVSAETSARMRRDERLARRADRKAARKQRAARRGDLVSWLRVHVVDLLFVPVIAVPAALAWTAMAAFGYQVFGPAGMALPAFSEGAMWAFAGATTIRRRRDETKPVWHLRAGTALFAAFGAALNFIHGLTPAHGAPRGTGVGVVMALVSVAGVVAHQLVTAGPRRSRAERDAARAERAISRRERAIARVARRRAIGELGADGNVRLMNRPGTVTLTRRWYGRAALEDVPLLAHSWPRPVPVLDAPSARRPKAPEELPAVSQPRAISAVPARHEKHAIARPADAPSEAASKPKVTRQKPSSARATKRAKAERLLRANPAMTRADLVRLSGVSERTADRVRADLNPDAKVVQIEARRA